MKDFLKEIYVPYSGKNPVPLLINGHRVLIVSSEPEELQEHLVELGGDHLQKIELESSGDQAQVVLEGLAKEIDGGVVVAGVDVEFESMLRGLEEGLPWVH